MSDDEAPTKPPDLKAFVDAFLDVVTPDPNEIVPGRFYHFRNGETYKCLRCGHVATTVMPENVVPFPGPKPKGV